MRDALREGIELGCTMTGLSGQLGTQRKHKEVFARQGKLCLRCGAPSQRLLLQSHKSFYCSVCQQPQQAETSN